MELLYLLLEIKYKKTPIKAIYPFGSKDIIDVINSVCARVSDIFNYLRKTKEIKT